ncbi:MAG: phosphate ABC transporter substrate-binding protein PstS [Candidatus Margulisiibacteriota bacterium]|jgi:phosphate transport system substrate-binding protein
MKIRKKIKNCLVIIFLFLASFSLASYATELIGAGATFPYPLYAKMFDEYNKIFDVAINYQAIGSGGGIRELQNKTVDFGATDAFLTNEELKGQKILHIPTALGAVVLIYNLPGITKLRLTPEIISSIYLGEIKNWQDPKIAKENGHLTLPNLPIFVTHRSDGSGTSFIFTDYLSQVNGTWAKKVGKGKSVEWPVGLGGKGNAGVSALVQQVPGTIGYAELIYAKQNKLSYAVIKNKAGFFARPDEKGVLAALKGIKIPNDLRLSLVNSDAKYGYPLSGLTWLIVYQEQNYLNHSFTKAKELKILLNWMLTEGQSYCKELDYVPLSKELQTKALKLLSTLTYNKKEVR